MCGYEHAYVGLTMETRGIRYLLGDAVTAVGCWKWVLGTELFQSQKKLLTLELSLQELSSSFWRLKGLFG